MTDTPNIVIVTKKEYCPFCEKAKNILKMKGLEYEEKTLGVNYTKEELLELVPTAKTVPQIWIDGKHIGGCDDMAEYFGLK